MGEPGRVREESGALLATPTARQPPPTLSVCFVRAVAGVHEGKVPAVVQGERLRSSTSTAGGEEDEEDEAKEDEEDDGGYSEGRGLATII